MEISKERYDLYLICLAVGIGSSIFDFNFSTVEDSFAANFIITPIVIAIIFVTIIIFAGNHYLKALAIWQKLSIVILHAVVLLLTIAFMNFLLAFLLQYITIGWIESILKFILLVGVLIPVLMVLGGIGLKLTDGKFIKYESE